MKINIIAGENVGYPDVAIMVNYILKDSHFYDDGIKKPRLYYIKDLDIHAKATKYEKSVTILIERLSKNESNK